MKCKLGSAKVVIKKGFFTPLATNEIPKGINKEVARGVSAK